MLIFSILKRSVLIGLFLVLSSCEAEELSLPDTFYGYGSWRFDTDETQLHDGVTGTAKIELEFTRQYENQYSISGTVSYVEEDMTCDSESTPNSICPLDTCTYVESTDGVILGVAQATESTLTLKPVFLNDESPKEKVHAVCADESEPAHETLAVYQTMGPNGAGFVDGTWTIDITDMNRAQAEFETEVGFVQAQGELTLSLDGLPLSP